MRESLFCTAIKAMTYRELWQLLAPKYGVGEAKSMARMVFEDRFGLSFSDICIGKDNDLSDNESIEMQKITSRLLGGEPIQYVIGSALFCGNRFFVSPDVLIPRPETAYIVERAVAFCKSLSPAPTLLDIGTGSGCIAVNIAKALPSVRVTAWDISQRAIDVATKNAQQLGASVEFVRQDVLLPPADTDLWNCIVSNPPYITRREQAAMEDNVLCHEPHLALFVDDNDPVIFYRAIANYAQTALKRDGLLVVEINPLFVEATVATIEQHGFRSTEVVEDEFGKKRFVVATRDKR